MIAAQARSVTAGPCSPGSQRASERRAAAASGARSLSTTTRSTIGSRPPSAPPAASSGGSGHQSTVGSSERSSGTQALAFPARVSPWMVSTTSSRAMVLAEPGARRQLVLTVASMPSPSPDSTSMIVREAWWSARPSMTSCMAASSPASGA